MGAPDQDANCGGTIDFTKRAAAGRRAFVGGLCGAAEEIRRIRQYVEMVMCYLRLDSDASDYVIREYDLDAIIRQALRENASVLYAKK